MLIRILFLAVIIYLTYRLIKIFVFGLPPKSGPNQIKGKPKNRPLDLSKMNVEDAQFEEIEEKTKDRQ